MSSVSAIPSVPAPPQVIHNCPSCSHWLPEGTLACPDCHTLAYGQYLSQLAFQAQQLEQEQKWPEARAMWLHALMWLPGDAQQAAGIAQHVASIDERLKAESDKKAKWKKRLGPFAPVALFLMKIKTFLLLAFKLKFLLSFVAIFAVYWAIWGWKFAAGFMACIFIHEMGHYVAVKRRGLKAELPIFGLMGAYVRWYGQGVSVEDIAAIALAGPLYGLVAALSCYAIYWGWHDPLFLVLANVGAWINIINLLPLFGLDGAQAIHALSQMQRAMLAATCLLFFALTLGTTLSYENAQFVFLIVGLGLLWKVFTRDVPENGHVGSFTYFQALVLVLGAVLVYTYPLMAAVQQ